MSEPAVASRTHEHPAPEQTPAPPVRAEQPEVAERAPALAGLAVRRRGGLPHDPLGGTAASGDVVDALRRRQGAGSPLAPDVAASFGEALGADLSGVRVHTDPEAQQITRSVQATAFTHGSDVYFGQGAFNPSSEAGQHLLGHELTHVVQQATGVDKGSGGTTIGRADDPLEKAADESASRVVGALRRRASAPDTDLHQHGPGCGHGQTTAPGRLRRVLAGAGVQIRRVLTDAAAIATAAANISVGHAYAKHVVRKREFTAQGINDQASFETMISQIMTSPSESKDLNRGRSAYWDDANGVIVFHDPGSGDEGTCFRPTEGKAYYDRQR